MLAKMTQFQEPSEITVPRLGRREHFWILCLAVIAIAGAHILDLSPEGKITLRSDHLGFAIQLPETCMSRRIFGISCPGCGLTRSFVAMAHGQIDMAIGANATGPMLFVLCWLQIPYRILRYLGYWQRFEFNPSCARAADTIIWIILIGLVLTWITKLIPAL